MDSDATRTDDLEAHLNPRVAVPDFASHIERYAYMSAETRTRLNSHIDIAFGDSPLEKLDVFPSGRHNSPVYIFIHGGYWRALDKSDHSFLAAPLVAAGAMAVVPNYNLCPAVTLDRIVAETKAAIAWTQRHAADYGGDPEHIYLSGHSAGAHLALMALADDEAGAIKGAVAISGIYDLRPVLRISVNDDLYLDEAMAARNSPALLTLGRRAQPVPLVIAVGADETPGWIQQSRQLTEIWRAQGQPIDYLEIPECNHFSILYGLDNPANALTAAMTKSLSIIRPHH